ncbi:MAG: AAA family ATPase [Halieaceae bacterium]|jgi:aminoglycoside phosphotransferase family enzyme/gluconate kinase|nr:AAA family ATPase [Halieaceae bacterium]
MDADTVRQLLRPGAFPHPGADIALRETHISWVVLGGEFAYKIKKPVNFGFLDFSTLALRRHFCERELALNRRYAPEIYLSLASVTAEPDGLRFDGDGPVVDYAVKMRRFDEGQLLDNIAARGELARPLVRAVARELAERQRDAPVCHPAPGSDEPGSPAVLRAAMTQNFQQVRDYRIGPGEQAQLNTIEQWTLARYASLAPLLEQRAASGMVIDGHGDAHLGNIALIDGAVRLFDCIEFNAALRVMDSIGEIAFLSMDLEARGHSGESHCVLTDYLEYRGDYAGLPLLQLYRCYFAMVRAKVALLREPAGTGSIQSSGAYAGFCRYLSLAQGYCQPTARFLAITHGVSGTGKSTVADRLVAACGAVRLRSDVERKRLFGLAPEQRSDPADRERLYSAAMSRRTFDRLEQLALLSLDAGFAVIVDATFLHRRTRDTFRQLATRLGLAFVIIDCSGAPRARLRDRLEQREREGVDASEAGVTVMEDQLEVDQALADVELAHRMAVDSGESADVLWQHLQDTLHRD